MTKKFFEIATETSKIKGSIVSEYFQAWSQVISSVLKKTGAADKRVGYIDLFSGPGYYDDRTPSTPILILEHAISVEYLCENLLSKFNDIRKLTAETLFENMKKLPGFEKLKYEPEVSYQPVDDEVVEILSKVRIFPSLLFADPFGYKGLTLKLINSVLQNWGCDCIFFFNYNRINAAITNSLVNEHIDGLFGKDRADVLRKSIAGLKPQNRERLLMSSFSDALKEKHGKYIRTFRFQKPKRAGTSHYLVFVTKNETAYKIMEDIMAKYSSSRIQDVPSFDFYPEVNEEKPLLKDLLKPLDDLVEDLPKVFAGHTMTTLDVWLKHSPGKIYILKNYKRALEILYNADRIKVDRKPRANTFADTIVVTFPSLS